MLCVDYFEQFLKKNIFMEEMDPLGILCDDTNVMIQQSFLICQFVWIRLRPTT